MARRALVTGAAAGLAAGVAAALPADGFQHVAITYRQTPPDVTLRAIRASGASVAAVRIDFLDEPSRIEADLRALARGEGPFDTLVHGVGPITVKRFERLNDDDYREMLDGNLRSAVLAARAVLPGMRDAGFGRIVFFGALGARDTRPFAGFSLYQAAKSGLTAFARCLAEEEARRGITVNVVVPGDIRDKSATRAAAHERAAANPRGRPGSFEDVADAVRFLIRAESDFVTGAVVEVNGGAQQADERNEAPA